MAVDTILGNKILGNEKNFWFTILGSRFSRNEKRKKGNLRYVFNFLLS